MLSYNKFKYYRYLVTGPLVLFLFFVNSLYAQERGLIESADVYMKLADSLFLNNEYSEAIENYKWAIHSYEDINWNKWYKAFTGLKKSRVKKKEINELIADINDVLRKSSVGDHFIKGRVYFYLGYYNETIGSILHANSAYKLALEEFLMIQDKKSEVSKFILYTYMNLSLNYSGLGDQKSAIKFCDLGIGLMESMDDKSRLCEFYLNKGKFLLLDNNIIDGIAHYKRSLEICNRNSEKAYIYQYLAEAYIVKDSLAQTQKYLDLSFKMDSLKAFEFFIIRGDFLKKCKQFDKAKREYELALKVLQNLGFKRFYLKTLTKYAEVLYLNNEKELALANAHATIRSFYPYLDSLDFTDRPKEDKLLPDVWVIEAQYIKAKYFRERYLETKDEFSLAEASYYYNLLLSHFDKLKSEHYASSSKYRMGSYSQKIYSEIILFYVDLFNKSGEKANLESAFSLAQRANSFVLRNAISDRKALELAGVRQDSLEYYLNLSSKVAIDENEGSINGAQVIMEFDTYKASLLANYPSYGKYDKEEEITIEKIQSSLRENALVLKYYYFNEMMTVFGISKHTVFAENMTFASNMDLLINSNLQILSQSESNDSLSSRYLKNSKIIYDRVLGDFLSKYNLQHIDHLIVIPDGPLKKVAFNTLAMDRFKDWNDPTSYLISKYAVHYLFYCSQLKEEAQSYAPKNGFVGFGIEYEDDFLQEVVNDYMVNFKVNENVVGATSLSPLKYADDEAIRAADIMRGTAFVNTEVTPSQVLSNINNFDVVHISAHAFVNEDDYLNSFVVLNKDEGKGYQLKYADILKLDLDSELVVLSACQTSSGKSVIGEGLMSLSRAFVQSGSRATVGAYWNTPDYATKELMTLFYSHLKEGLPKSRALQKAQMEYLTNDKISSPSIRSPFFWASWAIYGNDQPLNMQPTYFDVASSKSYLLLVALGLMLFLSFSFFRKRFPKL